MSGLASEGELVQWPLVLLEPDPLAEFLPKNGRKFEMDILFSRWIARKSHVEEDSMISDGDGEGGFGTVTLMPAQSVDEKRTWSQTADPVFPSKLVLNKEGQGLGQAL